MEGRGKRRHHAVGRAIELHEDQVPDFDEALAGIVGKLAGAGFGSEVVINFRARAARAGLAHLPEVVGFVQAEDARLGHARHFLPELLGVVIFAKDADVELVFGNGEIVREQLPGEGDGVLLEIVAEGEIAEHLEEGVMAAGVADVVEIVVLAAGADALLRSGGARVIALFEAGEDVLELVHARVGEEQRGVVGRHQRRAANDAMAVGREEVEERLADLIPCHVSLL